MEDIFLFVTWLKAEEIPQDNNMSVSGSGITTVSLNFKFLSCVFKSFLI